ncbi:uncharacterized protein LOC141913223 [Tubulanus polymorphus]|uniref:uncharacterized protein LOC141913223 n=1 Tax=Tubulanus polymorphus TaxID=672921 RepID=UPI003DA5AFF7
MLSCKDALVRSACGGTAADTVFRLHQILYRNAVKDQCKPALNEFRSPAEFIYDNRCTYSFPNRLDFCYNKFRESIPRVYKAFPVVIQGTYIDVAKPCRALSDYNKCIDPVTSMCSSGIRYIDDAFHWHTKTDMARVMCKISSDYIRHMVCYKDVVMKRDTKQCQTSKNITDKMLTDYYMYKCKTKSREKLELIDKNIKDLISCYERIVKARCGADAARTILPLLRVKYQTKQFRMDCTGKRVPLVTGNNYFIDHTSGNDRHFKITHYLSVLFQFLIVRLLSKINCR